MDRLNIYHRRDGRWEGRISCGRSKEGKRKFKYFISKSKDEVICRMRKFREEVTSKITCHKTFSIIYSEWFNSIQHRVKESTASNYATKAVKHIIPEIGDKVISEISKDDIYTFINKKLKEGLSSRYVADIVIMIKTIFKFATNCYHIFNPISEIRLPKIKKPQIRLFNDDESKKLYDYIHQNLNETTLGVAIAITTGIRIGELCAIQWNDIDLKKRILTVRKTIQRIQTREEEKKTKVIITEPKSESSIREIPLPDCIVPMLEKFKSYPEVYLISNNETPVEPRTMQYRFAKILKNVNLPSIHFHALRHMFASNCVKLGFDIKSLSEILGHSSVEITLNRYVHSSFEQKIHYMNRISVNF